MKLKKGVALLLASAAMVSLAGCGGNSGGSEAMLQMQQGETVNSRLCV